MYGADDAGLSLSLTALIYFIFTASLIVIIFIDINKRL